MQIYIACKFFLCKIFLVSSHLSVNLFVIQAEFCVFQGTLELRFQKEKYKKNHKQRTVYLKETL